MADISERLHLLPLQIIEVEDGAIVRRGTARVHIVGKGAGGAIQQIANVAVQGASEDEILDSFVEDDREAVKALIDDLRERRFLTPAIAADPPPPTGPETREDVFYWSFGASRGEVEADLAQRSVVIVGVNDVALAAAETLLQLGFAQVDVVDHPLLRNINYLDEAGAVDLAAWRGPTPLSYEDWSDADTLPDCLVVASDFGGPSLMREWNAFCVGEGTTLLPLVLHDFVGYAGPLVVPGKTACFECFWLRQNSNMDQPGIMRSAEEAAFLGQLVDGQSPVMAGVLGRVGAFELYKYFARRVPTWRPDVVIEIDLLDSTMKARKFLRAPRCPVCGAGARHGGVALEAMAEMPGNPLEV